MSPMRFQVPQFIEVEDKVVGPLTITQFVFVAGGVGSLVALSLILPLWLALILGAPLLLLGLALAFYKVNERPFIEVLESALRYSSGHKLYIWDKAARTPEPQEKEPLESAEKLVPAATASKIKDLAWSLDVKEGRMKRG